MFDGGDDHVKRKGVGEKRRWGVAFIIIQSRLCIFEILFWDPRVVFGRVFLPSDQEGLLEWRASVA